MIKRISLVFVFVLTLVLVTGSFSGKCAAFSGGDGTPENPYQVATKEDLNNVRNSLNAHFIQTDDIVFAASDFEIGGAFYNGGHGWEPIGLTYDNPFRGVYDGDGHAISGLYVNQIANNHNRNGGLFGALRGNAVIKNLNVSGDISYRCTFYATSANAGGIAAQLLGEFGGEEVPLIDNCTFEGNVSATGVLSIANSVIVSNAGGIAGMVRGGTIQNSSFRGGTVTAATVPTSGSRSYASAGGIAGNVEYDSWLSADTFLLNVYVSPSALISAVDSGENYAGGIVGQLRGGAKVVASYFGGNVSVDPADSGLALTGGVSGNNTGASEVYASYWIDSAGAVNQVGSDDSTFDIGKMSEGSMKETGLRDLLNNGLDVLQNDSLFLWQQAAGEYPMFSEEYWVQPEYTVTYDGNNNTGGSVPVDEESYYEGDAVTVLGNPGNLARTGYTFAGWNTETDGSGAAYAEGDPLEMGNSDITLYANWTINQYTITFDAAGGSQVTAITQDYGTAITAPTAPQMEGYTFSGWNPALPQTMPAENLTLTAQWSSSPVEDETTEPGDEENGETGETEETEELPATGSMIGWLAIIGLALIISGIYLFNCRTKVKVS